MDYSSLFGGGGGGGGGSGPSSSATASNTFGLGESGLSGNVIAVIAVSLVIVFALVLALRK
jgi:hypothetical protein